VSYQASNETTRRLRWHAGLEQAANGARISIAECIGVTRIGERLDEALNDLLSTLTQLNGELNGPAPSETTDGADQIPLQLVYAITEIIRMLRDDPSTDDAAWTVETAWNAVLAGDIDDLHEHLRLERAARRR
jgi:hypothetical protein